MDEATSEKVQSCIYTFTHPEEGFPRCVIALDEHTAASYFHSERVVLKVGDKYNLQNFKYSNEYVQSVISSVSENLDFIILKTKAALHFPMTSTSCYIGKSYIQFVINTNRTIFSKNGCIMERGLGYAVGTSHGEIDDSGGGIFDLAGNLIGISTAKKTVTFSDQTRPSLSAADHHPLVLIRPIELFTSCMDPIQLQHQYD